MCKKILGALLALCVFTGVFAGANIVFAAPNETQELSDFEAFVTAIEAGTPVQMDRNITAEGNIGKAGAYIDKDIVIHGNAYTLDMGPYQFLLEGSHTLQISDLTLKTSSGDSDQRYGVFCIAGGRYTDNYQWDAFFNNLSFSGSALVGTYNSEDYVGTKRYFNKAVFTGSTYINVNNDFGAYNAVVFARDVEMSDTFIMSDSTSGGNWGYTSPTYQHYFKSPGTGGLNTEADNDEANGSFTVAPGTYAVITRSPGKGTDMEASPYYRSLIFGYAAHSFGQECVFYAKAGTNRAPDGLEQRSAVIRSNNASSFAVDKLADIALEVASTNYTTGTHNNTQHGYTALSLKKSTNLEFTVDVAAELNISADGKNLDFEGKRDQAPVAIWGVGTSTTTVRGDLKVTSQNGNGWYYEYTTQAAGKATVIVENSARFDIEAKNQNQKQYGDYAAFSAGGNYPVELIARSGGKVEITGYGARGISFGGAGSYAEKSISVTGSGSEVWVTGVHWAIAAEGRPTLSIAARNGGKIDLRTSGVIGTGFTEEGSAPSTVYSAGPTTYVVEGTGAELNVYHSGGTYGAIFHDGYGPLQIDVAYGGVMDVYNRSSGDNATAQRAAITAQNTMLGPYGSGDNRITVSGSGSALTIVNENEGTHPTDAGLYPTGAVSFNETATGNIVVEDDAKFSAISTSLSPTIHLYKGELSIDNSEFEIRNNALRNYVANTPLLYPEEGHAVYNERYIDPVTGENYATAFRINNCNMTVWSVLENDVNFEDASIDNYWQDVSFSADNGSVAIVGKYGSGGDTTLALNQFDLSAYGRIAGKGAGGGTVIEISAPPTIHVVRSNASIVTGQGIAGAEVTVTFPNGSTVTAVVDATGMWAVQVTSFLVPGEHILAYQTEPGKQASEEVYTIVQNRY